MPRAKKTGLLPASIDPMTDEDIDATTWREDLLAFVDSIRYDFHQRVGTLVMPELCCCDAIGAIRLFTDIDPHVARIDTYSGEQPDVTYRRALTGWQCLWKGDTQREVIYLPPPVAQHEQDNWQKTIERVVENKGIVPTTTIWDALGVHATPRDNRHADRVAAIMRRLGFIGKRTFRGNVQCSYWVR